MQIEIEEIAYKAKEKLSENCAFLKFVGIEYGAEDDDLIADHIDHSLNEISRKIDCTNCGKCCEAIRPILGNKDQR